MEIISKRLTELKLDIVKDSSFNEFATKRASKIIDEIVRVFNQRLGRVTGKAPLDITQHFSTSFGSKSFNTGGKLRIENKIDSIKNDIVVNRIIPNDLTQWAVSKLNTIKRL